LAWHKELGGVISELKRLLLESPMDRLVPGEEISVAGAALLGALEIFGDELGGERRSGGFGFWRDAVGAGAGWAALASRQGVEVSWEKTSVGHARFDCFSAAVHNDWASGLDPFLDVCRRKADQCGDRSVKDVSVGGKDLGFVAVQVMQVAFELLQSTGAFLSFFGPVTFTIP
jgi:hypothetical protein